MITVYNKSNVCMHVFTKWLENLRPATVNFTSKTGNRFETRTNGRTRSRLQLTLLDHFFHSGIMSTDHAEDGLVTFTIGEQFKMFDDLCSTL